MRTAPRPGKKLRPLDSGYDREVMMSDRQKFSNRQREVVKYGIDLVETLESIHSEDYWNIYDITR